MEIVIFSLGRHEPAAVITGRRKGKKIIIIRNIM